MEAGSCIVLSQAPSGYGVFWSILQHAELALPGEGVGHDGCEVVELRLPPEQFPGAVGLRHDPCRIAGPWAGAIDTKIHAGHALDRIDDLKHGESVAVAAVERCRSAARPQIGERIGMGAHEIGDVNIVADA